jgi:hypothetical protein
MPRRELLTQTERTQLFAFPEDEGELIRLATLARADLTYIRQPRALYAFGGSGMWGRDGSPGVLKRVEYCGGPGT